MKNVFLKYYLSFVVLFFTAFTCFANQSEIKQVGYKGNKVATGFYQEVKATSTSIALKKGHDKGFHKETIHHTFINHLKANFHETEFEAETVVKLKKAKALFKFQVLSFARILSGKDFSEKALVSFKYSRLNSFLHSVLYLRLQVMRL